jgi:VanZ family protein
LKLLYLWGPVILVMALIYYTSSLSDLGAPPGGLSDKAAHFIAYAALGASLIRALAGGHSSAMTARRVLLATAIATLYGLSDELHQSFVPHRTPEALDLVADAAGGLTGAVALMAAARTLSMVLRRRARP